MGDTLEKGQGEVGLTSKHVKSFCTNALNILEVKCPYFGTFDVPYTHQHRTTQTHLTAHVLMSTAQTHMAVVILMSTAQTYCLISLGFPCTYEYCSHLDALILLNTTQTHLNTLVLMSTAQTHLTAPILMRTHLNTLVLTSATHSNLNPLIPIWLPLYS